MTSSPGDEASLLHAMGWQSVLRITGGMEEGETILSVNKNDTNGNKDNLVPVLTSTKDFRKKKL